MFRSVVIAAFAIVVTTATPSFAADNGDDQFLVAAEAAAASSLAADVDWSLPPIQIGSSPASRGTLLPSLYVSLAALNAFDAYSTAKAVGSGIGTEANPMMRGVASHSAAVWAVKGGVTAASIFLAERMWRNHNRVAAIATMVFVNGMTAAVAANNARVLAVR